MHRFLPRLLPALSVALFVVTPAAAQEEEERPAVYPTALLPFQERGDEAKDMGGKVTDLLFAKLVANPELYLVDREDLDKLISEQELNISGVVRPSDATKIGQLTGAKVLVTGSVIQVDTTLYLVAKIIGTETSRVLGSSVKGKTNDELDNLVDGLAEQVAGTITKQAKQLVAKEVSQVDRLAALRKQLGEGKRPAVFLDVPERHVGQPAVDPAAETELAIYCRETGFTVIDPDQGAKSDADVLLVGEGFSEFAARRGNLISVKARLELKAVDRKTGRVLAVDRQTSVAVDLTEQIAAKTALQSAAADVAERLLPKLVAEDGGKGKKKAKKKKG